MPKAIIQSITLDEVAVKIQDEIAQGRRELANRYHNIGRWTKEYILNGKDRAEYAENIIPNLSKKTGISVELLYKAVKFYEAYPKILGTSPELDWSDYSTLLTLPTKTERIKFEQKAIRQKLSARQLKEAVTKSNAKRKLLKIGAESSTNGAILPLERGKMYTYKILKPKSWNIPEGMIVVDCGFKHWRRVKLQAAMHFSEGDIIESRPADTNYHFQKSTNTLKSLYTFMAYLERIVDADTYWFQVDEGFDTMSLQEFRLRGIDCPELSTPAGRRAKRFIETIMKACSFAVIKTYKQEKYARYLTDIFYLPGETDVEKVAAEGIFLNQQLLDEGLAKVWK